MKTFGEWLTEEKEQPDGEVEVDGARVGYDVLGDSAIIVSFLGLDWMRPGVIEKAIEAVRQASGAQKVTTTPGIRQHWSYAGYTGY